MAGYTHHFENAENAHDAASSKSRARSEACLLNGGGGLSPKKVIVEHQADLCAKQIVIIYAEIGSVIWKYSGGGIRLRIMGGGHKIED